MGARTVKIVSRWANSTIRFLRTDMDVANQSDMRQGSWAAT